MTKKKAPKQKLTINKPVNPKYDRLIQLITQAKTEDERNKWKAVLNALENPKR